MLILFGFSIKAGKLKLKKKKKIWCKYVYSGMDPLIFSGILLHVFDTSPKLTVSHSTEVNSS